MATLFFISVVVTQKSVLQNSSYIIEADWSCKISLINYILFFCRMVEIAFEENPILKETREQMY